MKNGYVDQLADLLVSFGANVQPGQIVELTSDIGKEEVTRAVARRAYERGAKFVDVTYFDVHVKRSRLEHAAEDTLDYVPSWHGKRVLAMGEQRAAAILLTGPAAPGLFEGIDPARVGRDRMPSLKEYVQVINERTVNWSLAPCPTDAWARLVYPELEPAEALERLWEQVAHICRLDEPDPVAAWRARVEAVEGAAKRLTDLRFDAVHFEGPGTDLTVGLLPTSRWIIAKTTTVDGVEHFVNIPSEETFTTPDPARTEGVVRSTMPLDLQGLIVEDLEVRFEGGRAVQIDADKNAEIVRTVVARDEGAARLGEVALVDREGRIGPLETVFYDTLIDENAASHVAFGSAYEAAVGEEDHARINRSETHVDFMIGSPEITVTGVTGGGERVPVMRGGAWQV